MGRCSHCGRTNEPDNRFCEICGTPLHDRPDSDPGIAVVTVGREDDNTIVIAHDSSQVSRHHVRILLEDGRLYIEDLNTPNGTTVNGSAVDGRVRFSMKDQVRLGSYELDTDRLLPHLGAAQKAAKAPAPPPGPAVGPAPVNPGQNLPVPAPPPPVIVYPAPWNPAGPGPRAAAPARSKFSCPKCASENIVRQGIQRSGGGSGGCIGCLLIIIIIILAPGLVCGLGIVSGAILYTYQVEIAAGIVAIITLAVVIRLVMGNSYQCQRCGERFQL